MVHPAQVFLETPPKADGKDDQTPLNGKPWHGLALARIDDVEDRDQVPTGVDRCWEVSVSRKMLIVDDNGTYSKPYGALLMRDVSAARLDLYRPAGGWG
jgi:hypothetical protein